MSIEVELPDGSVLSFPEGTDKNVIEQTARRAIENPYSLKSTKELEAVPAAPSTFKDVSEFGAMSLAGGIKSLTDLFGVDTAASKKMEELQQEAFKRLSPERQRELAIEDELKRRADEEGTWSGIKQAGRSFLRSPLQQTVGAGFSSVPIIGATALAPEVAVPARIAAGTTLLPKITARMIASSPGIAVGAGMGVGGQKGQDYAAVKQAMLESGASKEEAEAAAIKASEYSLQNAPRQIGAGIAGGAEAALGVESLLGRAGRARTGVKSGPEAPTWGQAVGQSTFGEAIPEAIQSGVGAVGTNIALQQAGIDTDLFKGVGGEMASGALAAAMLGTAVSPLQMRQLRQEFANDQLNKQIEEQKKLFEEYQKRQQTEENLGANVLSLPAPAPKVEEKDPLQNPLGNLTKEELGPEVVGYIEQYRSKNGMPLLNSYSIEDVKDAMTQVNPAGEAAALDSLVAAKSGYKPDVTYSADDVLNAATNKVDTTTQGFRDFLNRTTGSSDLNTMSQPQLYAAFKALEAVPVGQGLTILPVGTNASRFTEVQMVQGLDAIANQLTKGNSVTPEQAITAVKQATGLQNDRDAASLIKQLVRDNNLDSDADNNLIAPTEVKNLPAGYTLEKGTFKQADQQLYGVLSDGKPLEGVDTYTNPEDAQAKVDALNKTREKQAKTIQDQIQKIQDQIDQSQQNLDAMEAAGEGGTDAYKQAKAQHEALVNKVTDNIHTLQARQMMFQTPLTMGPMGMKQVNRTGYTLFKDGVPVSTHPTADAAMDSLVGTLPDAEVEAIAEDRTPGMRTIARKARQRIERQSRPAPTQKKPEQKAPEVEVTEEDKKNAQVLYKALGRMLKKFGLRDVELQILKGMEDEGSYVANLIKIALDAKDALGVLRHESIHALKDLGFFSPQQWATLERMAKEKWIDQYLKGVAHDATRSRYDAYVDEYKGKKSEAELEELLIEEAIADAFRAFGNKPPPGLMTAILNKIKDFFARLKDAFNMAGIETAEEIFGRIERGGLKPQFAQAQGTTKKPSLINAWKATPEEVEKAEKYAEKNGIMPYISAGPLDLPIEKKSIKSADKYGMHKFESEFEFDPVLNIPLNKDGTVTVYYHTTKEEAVKINSSKKIPSNGKARIYLTNESNGAPIIKNRGNFDQTLDGSTVILNIDPSLLQVDQSYDGGRIDFYVPMRQGEYFDRKMRMASIQKSRKEAIAETFSYKEHEDRITAALAEYNALDFKGKRDRLRQAKDILKKEHNVGTLLTENGKLEKTRLGDFKIEGYDGKSVTSMGLGLASAQQITDKVSTCNRSAICEGLCLGETSGGNFLYGGAASEDVGDIEKGSFRAAARMFQYLKTEALIVHPEEFAIKLQAEIDSLKRWANKNDYDAAVRLNVTSDFKPSMFAGLMEANPGVMFYDYTKLNGDPIADNHHLTYSSTGFGQIVNGEPVFFKNKADQYDHNWGAVRKRLDDGYGVAMAFSSKSALPKFLRDEETGKTYQVWDGDLYDARFLDPKADDGVTGQIVGLRNKAATLKEKTATEKTGGFFINYDPKTDGDTVVVPNQSQFKGKVIPIAKKSLRAPNTKEFKRLFGDTKVVDEDGNPQVIYRGVVGTEQGIEEGALNAEPRMGYATFGSTSPYVANSYANPEAEFGETGAVTPLYIKADNLIEFPVSVDKYGVRRFDKFAFDRKAKSLPAGTALVARQVIDIGPRANAKIDPEKLYSYYSDIYAWGSGTVVKSATGNIGTYDATNPDIRKSLRAPDWVPQNIWDLHEKVILADDEASGRVAIPGRGKAPGALKRNQTMAFRRLNDAVDAYVGGDEQAALDLMARMNQESTRREEEAPVERKSLRAPDTKEFKQWFGESVIVNEDGTPKVMYHGTKANIRVAKTRGNRNAFFVSPDPNFAAKYALNDLDWHPEKKGFGPIEEGAQIYPVYIHATNPFDYENPEHMLLIIPQFRKVLKEEEGYNRAQIEELIDDFREGRWSAVEHASDYDLFEKNGFDAFYTKEQGRKNLGVFKPEQVKSAIGNRGTYSSTNPNIRKSLRAPDTPEFNNWFSDSKAVDKEGRAQVMYHGTARDISEFKPGVAKAIFISPDPEFAEIFSEDSFNWIANNAKDELSEADQTKTKETAIEQIEKDYEWLDKKDPDYKKLLAHKEGMIKDIQKNAFKKKLGDEAMGYLATAAKNYLPTAPNIMPLFVRAINPFDYENKKHIDMVVGRVLNFMPESVTTKMEFPEKYLAGLKGLLSRGLFTKLEEDAVQKAIRSLGFDSFYVKEMGRKNLAVYSPVQVKSATGNIGTYGLDNPDIRKSIRPPQVPEKLQRIVNETVAVREDKNWLQRLMSAIVPSESDAFRQAAINRYQRIGSKEKKAAKIDNIDQYTADVSAEFAALHSDYAAQLMASAMGVHDGKGGIPVYKNGITMIWNDDGKITGPLDIFQPLAQFGDKAFQHWQFWKSAQRGVRLEKDGKPTQFGQAELQAAKELAALYPKGLFEQVDKAWDRYNRGLVNYMIDTGVINRKMGEEWMKHGDYFPFYRQQMDEDAKGPKMFSAISGVKAPKELKGGDITVGDFFENIIRNTQAAIEAGMKNVAAQKAIDNEVKIGDAKEIVGFKGEPKRPTSMSSVVTVLRNGEVHYYEAVDKLFVESLKGLNMGEIPGLWLFSAPANLLRSFVTKTPDFILANMLRDSMSAWVTSGANITPVIDTVKGFGAAMAKTDPDLMVLYNAGLIGGYEFSGRARETGSRLAKKLRKSTGTKTMGEKALTPFTSVWEALESGSTASDAATRLAVYKNVMAETGNQAEAIKRAMEIMNFQRKGNSALIRFVAAAVPFLNARIQGLDVLYRAGIKPFVDRKNASEYEKQVANAFIKRGLMMAAMSVFYYMMVKDDEEYLAQEEEVRDGNWIIPGLGVKIPIPFEVGIIFKTIPERITALMFGNDTGAQFTDSMTRNIQQVFGLQLPQSILPAIEVATGYSFFTHRQITPQGLEDVNKKYQVAPGTSRLAEVVGEFTSFATATGQSYGLSPIQIDHLFKGYTGTLGTYFVDAVDVVINANSDIKSPTKRFEQMPFIRRFALDPDARGNVTAYYDFKNAVDEVVRTSNLLERTGKVEDLVEYQMNNMPLLASKDYVNDLYKTMKEFNDMKRMVRMSPMDPDDKRDIILAIQQSENALLSQIKEYKKMISQ